MADNEYVNHNFDAINKYVNEMQERHRVANADVRANVFSTYAKYSALFLVGVGVLAFLILFGSSLLKKKPEPKILKTNTVIERPIKLEPNIIIHGQTQQLRDLNSARNAASEKISSISKDKSGNNENKDINAIYNYTIFKRLPFNQEAIENVVVGMQYKNNDSRAPHHQWCYVEKLNLDGTKTIINLANKFNANKKNDNINYTQARKINVSLGTLKKAQTYCSFQ